MAGTEDVSFYYSIENSPFWLRKDEYPDDTNSYNEDQVRKWEKKLVSSPKYMKGKHSKKTVSH